MSKFKMIVMTIFCLVAFLLPVASFAQTDVVTNTTKTKITGVDVWEAMTKDPRCKNKIGFQPKIDEILREYIENELLVLFGDLVNQPVSIENLIKAYIVHQKGMLSRGIIAKMIGTIPAEEFSDEKERDEIILHMEKGLQKSIKIFESMLENLSGFLAETGLTEEKFYLSAGFRQEEIDRALKGELTIGELLIVNPSTIVAPAG